MKLNTSKSLWLKLGIVAVVLGCVLAFVWGRGGTKVLAVGNRAPNFTLRQVNAGTFTLRDGGHHVTLVNFWATWCPPCVEEAPSLEKFARQMRPQGVRVVGVSVDQNLPDLQKFIASYHLTFPIVRDPNQALAGRFGTHMFPETYIFDRDGRLADKIIGATDWEDPHMIQFVEALVHWPPAGVAESAAATSGGGY